MIFWCCAAEQTRGPSEDSDAGSGVLVGAPKNGADWVIVDEEPARSTGSSTVHVPAPISSTTDANADADDEAQLAAALEASTKDQRMRKVERMREDRNLQKAIEASKMEAVAYALGSIDAGVEEEGLDDDSDSTTGWTSSEDEETDVTAAEEDVVPHTDEEIRQHTIERLRVLEAAGVLVKAPANEDGSGASKDVKSSESKAKVTRRPPPPPGQKHKNIDELVMLSRSRTAKRPLKPEEPQRRRPPHRPRKKPSRDLPPVPAATEEAPEDRMEDAYDRYLKLTKEVSLQPILPATAPGAGVGIPPSSPPPFATGSPARPSSAAGESASRTAGFLSTIKSMGQRSAWTGTASPRPDSGVGSRIVSGPIAVTPSSGLQPLASISGPSGTSGGDASPAARAATSWSSLVDPPLLLTLTDAERKRQEAIFELIATETAHVRDLQIVVEVFFNSMQSLLSAKATTVIFANIEEVLFTSVSMLSDLEARQKEDRLFVTRVGDVLERHMGGMGVYLPYCVNQGSARDILEAARKRDTRVDIHLVNLRSNHPAARGLDLSHFLLVPMQRLTRYPLLIGQIQRYTPEDHPDYPQVKAAKETAEGILAKTNEAIRDNEDNTALAKLSENLWLGEEARLDLTKPYTDPSEPGVKKHRRIIRDEMVTKAKSGRKLRLVLTTDLLLVLHAQDGSLYRMPIPVNEVRAEEAKGKRHGDEFRVVHEMRGVQGDVLKVKAGSARNAQVWVRAVNAARGGEMGVKA